MYTQVILILILIDVQYLQNIAFSFEKSLNGQNHSSAHSEHPIKNPPAAKFPIPSLWGMISPYPFHVISKTLTCFIFPSWGAEIFSTYFSVWLWTVTQFNTDKNEMFLKVLLIIGNGFLISSWKCWVWISKNERILRTTAWKGCWLLFYSEFCVGVSLYFS